MSGSAFMSYSRDDSAFALRLAQDLKAAGAKVWLDQLDIRAGASWDNAIEDALNHATHLLIILSAASTASKNVRDEVAYAMDQGKIVIPILYTECDNVPLRLHRSQHIDFRADYACGLTALVNQLHGSPPVPLPEDDDANHPQHGKAQETSHVAPALPFTDPHRHSPIQQPPQQSSNPPPHKPWWSNPALPISLASLVLIVAVASAAMWVHRDNSPAALYQKAIVASSLKDYSDAATLFKQACKLDNAKSCTALAQLYETKKPGVPTEPGFVMGSYQKACDSRDFEACSAMGRLFYIGDVFKKDLHQAFEFDQKACNGGDPAGCSQLGILYLRGEGVVRDPAKAIDLFQKACNGNDPEGCSALGKHYADGDFVPKDTKKAADLDQKACDAGHASSCTRLGDLYRIGDGVGQNLYTAKQFYQKGCLAGDGKACDAWLNPAPNVASKN